MLSFFVHDYDEDLWDKCTWYEYSSGHANHPCTKWIADSLHNYIWFLTFLNACHDEWLRRGFKYHASINVINNVDYYTSYIEHPAPGHIQFTDPPLAMPRWVVKLDARPHQNYRRYYKIIKARQFRMRWTKIKPWFDSDRIYNEHNQNCKTKV